MFKIQNNGNNQYNEISSGNNVVSARTDTSEITPNASLARWKISTSFKTMFPLNSEIPEVGKIVKYSDLNIAFSTVKEAENDTSGRTLIPIPDDFDNQTTENMPGYSKKFPNVKLNLPLHDDPSAKVNSLVVSDLPETIKDTNKVNHGQAQSADGVYCEVYEIPPGKTRILLDHLNAGKENKDIALYITPAENDEMKLSRRGEAVDKNPVRAGERSLNYFSLHNPSTTINLKKGEPCNITGNVNRQIGIMAGQCGVGLYEIETHVPIKVRIVVSQRGPLKNPTEQELSELPKMDEIRWKDKGEKELSKWVDPKKYPTRFNRLLFEQIHPRGLFTNPDKKCSATYNYFDGDTHFFSPAEAIPGVDTTSGVGFFTENRGNYGANIKLNIRIKNLPPGCKKMALVAINGTSGVMGGKYSVDIKGKTTETTFQNENLMKTGDAGVIWKGEVSEGMTISATHMALNNACEKTIYTLIPIY